MTTQRRLRHQRWQHPIGQGFFHTGLIHIGGKSTRYIYDCGSDTISSTNFGSRLKLFRQTIDSGVIELTFVSHLHRDHVNGFPLLLGNGSRPLVRLKNVVMPYLSPAERIFLAYEAKTADKADGFYIEFLADPAGWFLGRGVDRVIYVSSPPPDEEPRRQDKPRPNASNYDQASNKDEQELEFIIPPNTEASTVDPGEAPHEKLITINHRNVLRLRGTKDQLPYWNFATYVDPDWSGRERIKRHLAASLGMQESELAQNLSRPGWLQNILATPQKLKLIRGCYQAAAKGGLNITSLSLFSGPERQVINGDYTHFVFEELQMAFRLRLPGPKRGNRYTGAWLGTGDAELGAHKPDQIAKFVDHFRNNFDYNYLDDVTTMTLPHHGSLHNFDIGLMMDVRPFFAVMSAGYKSKHHHPHPGVIESIIHLGIDFFVVTDRSRDGLRESLRWPLS